MELRKPGIGLVSYVALFVLLAGRMPLANAGILHSILGPAALPGWVQGLVIAQDLLSYVYASAGIFILAVVIFLNRRDLSKLNIDGTFLFLFIWAALAFALLYLLWPVGWAAAILAVFTPLMLWRAGNRFGKTGRAALWATAAVLIAFFVCLILVRGILDPPMLQSAAHWMLIDFPPNVVVEEVLFRGLLWMFLRRLGWTDGPVLAVQSVLFWLAHAGYFFSDPVGFWIVVPVLTLVLGIIVWKTRSLTPSTIAHICMNAAWSLFLYAAR